MCDGIGDVTALFPVFAELYHLELLKGPPPKRPYHPAPVQTIGQPSASHQEKKGKGKPTSGKGS